MDDLNVYSTSHQQLEKVIQQTAYVMEKTGLNLGLGLFLGLWLGPKSSPHIHFHVFQLIWSATDVLFTVVRYCKS